MTHILFAPICPAFFSSLNQTKEKSTVKLQILMMKNALHFGRNHRLALPEGKDSKNPRRNRRHVSAGI